MTIMGFLLKLMQVLVTPFFMKPEIGQKVSSAFEGKKPGFSAA